MQQHQISYHHFNTSGHRPTQALPATPLVKPHPKLQHQNTSASTIQLPSPFQTAKPNSAHAPRHGNPRVGHCKSSPLSIPLPRRPHLHKPPLSRHLHPTTLLNTDAVLPPQCPGLPILYTNTSRRTFSRNLFSIHTFPVTMLNPSQELQRLHPQQHSPLDGPQCLSCEISRRPVKGTSRRLKTKHKAPTPAYSIHNQRCAASCCASGGDGIYCQRRRISPSVDKLRRLV